MKKPPKKVRMFLIISEKLRDKVHPEGIFYIDMAYRLAKAAHRGQVRKSGERAFNHMQGCMQIMIDECYIYDYQMICGILLHDSKEDTFILTPEMMEHIFGKNIRKYIDALTKKTPDQIVESKTKLDLDYHRSIYFSEQKVIIMKLIDRLQNMRTVQHFTLAKQIEYARETITVFLPLAKKRHDYLYKELKKICAQYVKKYPQTFIDLVDDKGRIKV